MNAPSRTAQFAKVHKVLRKHYKPHPPNVGRTVLEHLLFACCLEDAPHDPAEEAFAALVHTFFDWNEIRVTSVSELSEAISALPDSRGAANRVKRVLHAVFEATFAFDLEDTRKKNIGPTVEWLTKLDGTTPFTVAYVVQSALGGHAIPIDGGTMAVLLVLGLVDEKDAKAGNVPGLERAVAKSKGIEFGSVLHEMGANYSANPYGSAIREILLTINPECESRFPKRRVKRAPAKTEKNTPSKRKSAGTESPKADEPKTRKSKTPSRSGKASVGREKITTKGKAADKKKSSSRTAVPKKRASSKGLSKRKPR